MTTSNKVYYYNSNVWTNFDQFIAEEASLEPLPFVEGPPNVFPEPCPVSHQGCCSTLVGSCLAVGSGKDIDYLFYCPMARHDAFTAQLKADGWEKESHEYISSDFTSWRKDKFNLIVTCDFDWYKKFEKAAKLCQDLALESKEDRILVHNAFLEKEKAEDDEVPF